MNTMAFEIRAQAINMLVVLVVCLPVASMMAKLLAYWIREKISCPSK